MAESAVNTVLGSLGNLAVQETKFLCGVTLEVGFLKEELMRLQAYLKDADNKWRSGNARVSVLVSQIRSAAYEAQNVIEAADHMEKRKRLKNGFMGAISRYARLPSDLVTLHKLGSEIQHVRRKLREILVGAEFSTLIPDEGGVAHDEFLHDFENSDVMVGFEDEKEEIVDKLVDNENMLSAISIVAMGGAGKTTLAKNVYTSSRVKQHFDVVAWVTVSQTFKSINLLKDILKQVAGNTYDSVDQMQEHEVRKKIHEYLLHKRYLVVLDDVWDADTWDQLNRTVKAFPDTANGSRLLLTTRKEDVAYHVEMPTHVHTLRLLEKEKSWDLFRSKALPSYRMPAMCDMDEFEELGRKLASKCDGLPLALAVLGGYLSKNMNTQAWSDVLLGWPSTKNVDMMRDILARSYKDLPNSHLKSCFLYLAAFPEDCIIDVSVLIALWIAEGFIPHVPKHKQEETARKYVAELAQRSLVHVTSRNMAHAWIEEIRVHDILRDWCIEEARQDGFLDVIDKTSGHVSYNLFAYSVFLYSSITETAKEANSLAPLFGFKGPNLKAPPILRSLIVFQIPQISFPILRFLRVLHIEDSRIRDFSSAIGGCIHLRCLRLINCEDVTIPSSIGKLLYLQTIDMTGTNSVVPKSMWDIPSLRHVYLSGWFSPPRVVQPNELRTLSLDLSGWVSPPRGIDANARNLRMVTFLGQLTQLTTLSFATRASMPADMMNVLANMPLLVDVELRQLSPVYKLPDSHHFSQCLRSFDLTIDAITQDPMPVLEKLPCLVVLKLCGYRGLTMSCSAQGFPRLQMLQLYDFSDIKVWKIEIGSMPKLSQLTLCKFRMGILPTGFLHLPRLNHLELQDMPLISVGGNYTLEKLQQNGCEVFPQSLLALPHVLY
ncbi:hypothetical protein ACQ4PT_042777 [Festuca glaucescens]